MIRNNVFRQKRYLGEGDAPPPPVPPKTFEQKDVDAIVQKRLAEEKKNFDKVRAADLERMATLETDSKAKADLETQLAELNNRYKSKEELAADNYKKERASWEEKAKKSEEEKLNWKKRWEEQTRDAELLGAAAAKEADVRSTEQVLMLLKPMSKVVEKVVEGKPSGDYETRIFFPKDGKVMDIAPAEAIKLMKADVPRWGNLFNTDKVGGMNGNPSAGSPGADSLMGLSQEEFTKRYIAGTLPSKVK